MERMNGEIRDRKRVMRTLEKSENAQSKSSVITALVLQ
jgi:hypothetical protein